MKRSLRKEILGKRAVLSESDWIEHSAMIQQRLMETSFYQKAGAILLYCHFNKEVKTDTLIEDALKKGKKICIPFNDWKTKTLTPSIIYSPADIDRRGRKVPKPFILKAFPAEKIDLAVIPGVVFDIYGNRIGMGKGFFDEFLESCGKYFLKVGIAFDFQVIGERLPVDSWDRKMDVIITETRIIRTGKPIC